jgi:hypothetical protein
VANTLVITGWFFHYHNARIVMLPLLGLPKISISSGDHPLFFSNALIYARMEGKCLTVVSVVSAMVNVERR